MDKILDINLLILDWYHQNKRILPWRETKNPYKIWLSEIILQQTRVDQGLNYYLHFTQTYPDIQSLAKASENDVLKSWQGLGYYSRARNLHHTAKVVYENFGGVFPDNFHALKQLKGIGDYTAAAISSICFDEAVPALDGNMYRVFARYFGIYDDISIPKTKKIFFDLGLQIIDQKNPGDFNQAIMDLGATVCTPKKPNCEICPLNDSCFALQKGEQLNLPVKTKKTKVKDRFLNFYFIRNEESFLISKRTGKDVWKSLYTLPLIETTTENNPENIFDLNNSNTPEFLYQEKHILSHQNLWIKFFSLDVNSTDYQNLIKKNNFESIKIEDLQYYPLPKPIEKFMILNNFD